MEKTKINPEETRQKVMEMARRLFVQKGYFNTSIPDIVEMSGMSIGSIYHHFGSKQELAKVLYDETLHAFVQEMIQRTAREKSIKNKLYVFVNFLYELCDEDPIRMEYMLFIKHTEIFPEHIPICLSEPFQTVTAWIEEGIQIKEVIEGTPIILTSVFMGGVLKILELRLSGVLDKPLKDVLDETFQLAWKAISIN
jgi:TetR/AcrR family transcriptional regulator, repressor of fatR-cypB operon